MTIQRVTSPGVIEIEDVFIRKRQFSSHLVRQPNRVFYFIIDSDALCPDQLTIMPTGYTAPDPLAQPTLYYKLAPSSLSYDDTVATCTGEGSILAGFENADQKALMRDFIDSIG